MIQYLCGTGNSHFNPAGIPISEKSKHFEAATKPQKPKAVFSIAVFGRFSLLSLTRVAPKQSRQVCAGLLPATLRSRLKAHARNDGLVDIALAPRFHRLSKRGVFLSKPLVLPLGPGTSLAFGSGASLDFR
jgi:hypothetical protein